MPFKNHLFKPYKELMYGEAFRLRGINWVKTPLMESEGVFFNALQVWAAQDKGDSDAKRLTCKVHEATLVDVVSEIEASVRLHYMRLLEKFRHT